MGYRWGAGRGAVRARLAWWISTGVVFVLFAAGTAAQMRAEGWPHPLDHHAVVLNGNVIGSAFQIGDGIAVTNRHVVTGLRPGSAVVLLASGRSRAYADGWVIAVSPRMDLALLRVPRNFLPQVASADAPVEAGLPVTAAGIDASEGPAGQSFETEGVVLAAHEDIPAFGPGLVARLPGARPGFSGGPLFDHRGRLVGMVTAIRPGQGGIVAGAAGQRSGRGRSAVEAFALRAAEIRAEVRRLLAATNP